MHVLMSAMPFGGHQPPMRGIAAELVRRGHRVTYYTGAKYRDGAERDGATWLPWRQATDFDATTSRPRFRRCAAGAGSARFSTASGSCSSAPAPNSWPT